MGRSSSRARTHKGAASAAAEETPLGQPQPQQMQAQALAQAQRGKAEAETEVQGGWTRLHLYALLYIFVTCAVGAAVGMGALVASIFVLVVATGAVEGSIFVKAGQGQYSSLQDTYRWDGRGKVVVASASASVARATINGRMQ